MSSSISYKIPSDIAKLGALTNVLNVSDSGNSIGIGTVPEETLHIDGGLRIDSNDVQKIEFDDTGQSNQHVHGTLSFATDTTTTPHSSAKFTVATSSSSGALPEDKFTINGVGAIAIGTSQEYGTEGQVLTTNGPNSSVSWSIPVSSSAVVNTTLAGSTTYYALLSSSNAAQTGENVFKTADLKFDTTNKRLTINGDAYYFGNNSVNLAGGNYGINFYSDYNNSPGNALLFDHTLATFSPTSGRDGQYSLGSSGRRWSNVWATNGTINTSDDRLKINEKPITGALKLINNLEYYEYDKVNTPDGTDVTHKERGVIAQHLLNTDLSYTLSGGKTETIKDPIATETKYIPYGVKYNDLFVTLCSAVKELNTLVNTLEARIKVLESK